MMPNAKPLRLPGCSVLPPLEPGPAPQNKPPAKAGKPKKTAERYGTINAFVDFDLANLTRNEIAVWLVLWRDTKNGTARTAQSDIARRAGIVRRTVVRVLSTLEAKGLLQRVHRGGLNRGMSVYRVQPLDRLPQHVTKFCHSDM